MTARRLWVIQVTAPFDKLNEQMRDELFVAVADAAVGWEPDERDEWDVDVSASTEDAKDDG